MRAASGGALVLAVLGGCAALHPLKPVETVRWRHSTPVGLPHAGRLVNGVRLPSQGRRFFTWDPVLRRSPNRAWRRWGTDRLVRTLLVVLERYAAAHPNAPRVGIGDLSRPHGGDFGVRFGLPGHVSHQNGLDADVYYPRRDRRERPPSRPGQIDRRLSQDLLNRFLRAGAEVVFVGPRTGLRGARVQVLGHHDNHMHVRLRRKAPRKRLAVTRLELGRSALGRRISAVRIDTPGTARTVLVVGCIHGDECAGAVVTRSLARDGLAPSGRDLLLVHDLNPDGSSRRTRQNGRGVDLNRNFASEWHAGGRRWDAEYPGPRPLSEPESRIARRLVLRFRPEVTVWFHQPQAVVRAWGESMPRARRYARLTGMRFRAIRWPPGSAPNWQNRRFRATTSFVVELPAGRLSPAAARRHARAVLALAQ
jgi:Penicillin-insensitive murein endopeptidase/Zinc carboxypeptidase